VSSQFDPVLDEDAAPRQAHAGVVVRRTEFRVFVSLNLAKIKNDSSRPLLIIKTSTSDRSGALLQAPLERQPDKGVGAQLRFESTKAILLLG
jgi:hypothetical protein